MRWWIHILFGHEWSLEGDPPDLTCICWPCKIFRWKT